MNVNTEIQNFIESKIKSNEALKKFFDAGFQLYYESTPENPQRPYLRYLIDAPVPQARDLQLNFTSYLCVVTINVIGNSIEQVRFISDEIFNEFDKLVNVTNYPNIEDVTSTYPEENISFDAQTSQKNFETSQQIQFYFVL